MAENSGLLHKINRAFLMQGLLIAVAAVLGVFFAKIVIEEILIKNAILEEETYFWDHYAANPQFSLPDTKNLTGFFDPQELPELVRQNLPDKPGFHEFGEGDKRMVLHISRRAQETLYLLYFRGQVDALVIYYGMFPLFTVLLILYLSLWLTYRFNRRTVSPVIKLAEQIDKLDLTKADFSFDIDQQLSFDADNEIQILSEAITGLGQRLNQFITREREFTRDASHELRSPMTVMNLAADMPLSEQELSSPAYKSVMRIKRAITDMEQLTEVFLLLARENDAVLTRDFVMVNDVVQEEIAQANILKQNKQVEIQYDPQNAIRLWASDKVVSVVLGNLIRNAINYTEYGKIHIEVNNQSVVIDDSGQGMSPQQVDSMFKPFRRGENINASGYGIGLTIVKRLCDRFHWQIEVSSEAGKGTQCRLIFPDSEVYEL
jgi:signal transduction histidine kinase